MLREGRVGVCLIIFFFYIQYYGVGTCCYTTLIILILLRNSLAVKLLLLMCSVADDWADLHLAARFLVLMGGRRGKRFYSHLLFISWLIDPVPPLNSSVKPSPGQGISVLGVACPKKDLGSVTNRANSNSSDCIAVNSCVGQCFALSLY